MKRFARSQKKSLALERKNAKADFKNINAWRNSRWERQESLKIHSGFLNLRDYLSNEFNDGAFGKANAVNRVKLGVLDHTGLPKARKLRIGLLEKRSTEFSFLALAAASGKPVPRAKAMLLLRELVRYSESSLDSRVKLFRLNGTKRTVLQPKEFGKAILDLVKFVKSENSELFLIDPKLVGFALMYNRAEINELLGKRASFYWNEMSRELQMLG